MKIKDLTNGEVFEYGSNHHHALRISADGKCLYFEHMQNGDGSLGEYRFVDDYEEKIPDETETVKRYGPYCYFNIGGFDTGYDINKVVEQLEQLQDIERLTGRGYCPEIDEEDSDLSCLTSELGCGYCAFEKAIEIVKGGKE